MAIFLMDFKPFRIKNYDYQYSLCVENTSDVANLESYGESINAAPGSTAYVVPTGDVYILGATAGWVKL
jgi:hypothetical protein